MLSKTAFNRMKKAELVEWALETQRTAGEAALFAEEEVEEVARERKPSDFQRLVRTAYFSDTGRALSEVREYLQRLDHDGTVSGFDQIMEDECPAWLNAHKADMAGDLPSEEEDVEEPDRTEAEDRCRAFLSELETLHDSVVKENKQLKTEISEMKRDIAELSKGSMLKKYVDPVRTEGSRALFQGIGWVELA